MAIVKTSRWFSLSWLYKFINFSINWNSGNSSLVQLVHVAMIIDILFRLCCVELWHLVSGVDNKVPQLHAIQSEPLDKYFVVVCSSIFIYQEAFSKRLAFFATPSKQSFIIICSAIWITICHLADCLTHERHYENKILNW